MQFRHCALLEHIEQCFDRRNCPLSLVSNDISLHGALLCSTGDIGNGYVKKVKKTKVLGCRCRVQCQGRVFCAFLLAWPHCI